MVPLTEISDAKNDYNLNLPRYIDSTEPEDVQDIEAHLRGSIPNRDIDALGRYWQVLTNVRAALFAPADRPGYSQLRHSIPEIKPAIFSHPEFTAFNAAMSDLFGAWKTANRPHLAGLTIGSKPKELIAAWEPRLAVTVNGFFVQQMKTKWGSCNPISRTIRLNTELAKKPIVCLEYIVAHEMLHLLEPTHSARFTVLLDRHMPQWRHHRATLNRLPVRHEHWCH